MLANFTDTQPGIGALASDTHKPATFLHEMVNFVRGQLPVWRDRKDRPEETAETALTSQLCGHLNSAARHTSGWDILQFRVEETDETNRGRKVDIAPAPCGTMIWVDGRRYTDFDILLPIECKRLPTPKGSDRDEREYVFSDTSSTGGIQRFKEGKHGASHTTGTMIGYIQDKDTGHWRSTVGDWINSLADSGQVGWSKGDLLSLEEDDVANGLYIQRSNHKRANDLPDMSLTHLWVTMKRSGT